MDTRFITHLKKNVMTSSLQAAGAHVRRRFDETVKALPKEKRRDALAYLALKQIQAVYREENKLAELSAKERLQHRRLIIKPMVDAYFARVKENLNKVPKKGETYNGFSYSINQEQYLGVFLEDGEVPMDNNATKQSICGFCIGKKNWVMIDTIAEAESSAVIYSLQHCRNCQGKQLKAIRLFRIFIIRDSKTHG